ncbi:glycosyltransferase family 32 protein [Chryseobacterium taihuense]|uniref:Glycosyltransferase sugar-binding region containing DXD motif-containing protein n=1 Tax=Chryseobacterium taihuense TaxID=1141221 RepID=A0ABY0QSQ6_9FLAO|nr:glycosyltransferase [Chryseobacterium taihuense]SDL77178.1 Glycosyltransferase sugar-binding region containing DXD motif-containing protein [Chryseobacterium taihuense]
MIPKVLHYCWFGKNPLPELVEKCLATWQIILPDYEIRRWDESNFDVFQNDYIKEAYEAKKYAFVSDFARFQILYDEGGIYLDTDVEVLKSLDVFLEHKLFTGFENERSVAPGLILGSVPQSELMAVFRDYYLNKKFKLPDGTLNTESIVTIMTKILVEKGLKLDGSYQVIENFVIYPPEYFSPKGYNTGKMLITENTYTIHHYAGSWLTSKERFKVFAYQMAHKLLGAENFRKLKKALKL